MKTTQNQPKSQKERAKQLNKQWAITANWHTNFDNESETDCVAFGITEVSLWNPHKQAHISLTDKVATASDIETARSEFFSHLKIWSRKVTGNSYIKIESRK